MVKNRGSVRTIVVRKVNKKTAASTGGINEENGVTKKKTRHLLLPCAKINPPHKDPGNGRWYHRVR
jgi:hypothetical protein